MSVFTREINDKLTWTSTHFTTVTPSNQSWTHLPLTDNPPSLLNEDDFDNVKFWKKALWNTYERAQKDATNGNVTKGKKQGQPEEETPDDNCDSVEPNTMHIYLETEDGIPVLKALITQQGWKMHSVWATLHQYSVAPMVWHDVDSLTARFMDSMMLNDP